MRSDGTRSERSQDDSGDFRIDFGLKARVSTDGSGDLRRWCPHLGQLAFDKYASL